MTSITTVPPSVRSRATSTLTLAFAQDPVVRWVLADPHAYVTIWPRFIEAFAGAAFESGTADASEGCLAVALWLSPGAASDEAEMVRLMYEDSDESLRPDIDGLFEQMDEMHPSFEHRYLPLMGVDPTAQGRGLGTALLRHGLDECDRAGLPAYLEATSPRSRDLYARNGFEEIGVIQQRASPPMWSMLRQPI